MRELDKVLNENEKVFWEGSPVFWPFFLQSSFSILTIILILFLFFSLPAYFSEEYSGWFIFFNPPFLISSFSLFGFMIYSLLVFKHTYYAITDKRVIIQKGWIGRDFEIIDFDQISNARVNVGVFDKFFGNGNTGSIFISSAGSFTGQQENSIIKPYIICNILNPYEVFKSLKKISHDIKTDIHYPNKLRPSENPGYQTEYNQDKK